MNAGAGTQPGAAVPQTWLVDSRQKQGTAK